MIQTENKKVDFRLFFQDDWPLTLSIGMGKFLKQSQKIHEPSHELHQVSVMIAYFVDSLSRSLWLCFVGIMTDMWCNSLGGSFSFRLVFKKIFIMNFKAI